jgi:hypothetical protein
MIVAFLAPTVAAQQKVRDKTQGGAGEPAQRREQAIDILKGVVETAADIKETQTRVAVLTGALDLLWKHDEAYARENFIKSADALSERFASDITQRQERSEIRAAMGVLLMAFARHDPHVAARLLDKFQKLLEDVLKGNTLSLNERLSLAQASLDSDAAQSAALAAKVLEAGVPGSLPSYLNELEQRDADAAASLFRVALPIIASGRVYNPLQVTILSTYAFRESQMSVPMLRGGKEGVPLEFGMFASPLSPPSRALNRELVTAYLAAAGAYLNSELIGLERPGVPDVYHVTFLWFLVKKLGGYADRLGLNGGQNWGLLDAKYTLLAERMKLSDPVLSGLATVAQRIVAENTVFRFDSGEAAFTAAEKTKDPDERAQLMVLSAALAASDAKKNKMSSEFLLTAMALLAKIEDPDARAAALVTTAGIVSGTANASLGAQVLTEAVNAINRANGYVGVVYGVTLEVNKAKVWLSLSKFDLSHCFEQAAKRDWSGALAAAQSIESKTLRSQAYIAACRNVL